MDKSNAIEVAKQYVMAFKKVNPELISQHFLPTAFKTGYFYDFENKDWTELNHHSFDQMREWTKTYNLENIMPDSEISATLLDKQDKMAMVKINAEWAPNVWGCDYVALLWEKQQWLIAAVYWQSLI